MEDPKKRTAAWPAVYFIRDDLKNEKARLVDDMRGMSMNYWAGTDPIQDAMLKNIGDRIEEINKILHNVNMGNYEAPSDD
mgnify:CR=1 FL=1